MRPTFRVVHHDFRLNGHSFTFEDLKEVSYSFIKEGEPFEAALGNFLADWLSNGETITAQTSGSTGLAKTIVLEKEKMVNSALATGAFFKLKAGDKALLCLPADYIAGKMMLVRALVLGLHLWCVPPSSTPLSKNERRYDFVAMIPLQLENSLPELRWIKILIVGGAAVSPLLQGKVQACATQVFETYGMTETITHIALRRINGVALAKEPFRCLPDIRVSVDERACLSIAAPTIVNGTIQTNDVVELLSNTAFEWKGRYDTVINSGGVKLNPEQIEAKLASLIKNRYFVFGVPDESLGQRLVLLVEGDIDQKSVLQKIRSLSSLTKFERPKQVISVPCFSETKSGKVQRDLTVAAVLESYDKT